MAAHMISVKIQSQNSPLHTILGIRLEDPSSIVRKIRARASKRATPHKSRPRMRPAATCLSLLLLSYNELRNNRRARHDATFLFHVARYTLYYIFHYVPLYMFIYIAIRVFVERCAVRAISSSLSRAVSFYFLFYVSNIICVNYCKF